MPVIALIQFCTYLVTIIPPRGSVRVRVSSYANINRGTYVSACVPATSHDVAAKPRAAKPRPTRRSRRPRGEAADLRASPRACGKATSCRGNAASGKAAYNLVKYYLAFVFKLFYYVLFDL